MKKNSAWYVFLLAILVTINAITIMLAKQWTFSYVLGVFCINYSIIIFFIMSINVNKGIQNYTLSYPIALITLIYSLLCIVCGVVCLLFPNILATPILIALLFLTIVWGVIVIPIIHRNSDATAAGQSENNSIEMIRNWERQINNAAVYARNNELREELVKTAASCQYLAKSTASKYIIYNERITNLCNTLEEKADSIDDVCIGNILEEIKLNIRKRKNA